MSRLIFLLSHSLFFLFSLELAYLQLGTTSLGKKKLSRVCSCSSANTVHLLSGLSWLKCNAGIQRAQCYILRLSTDCKTLHSGSNSPKKPSCFFLLCCCQRFVMTNAEVSTEAQSSFFSVAVIFWRNWLNYYTLSTLIQLYFGFSSFETVALKVDVSHLLFSCWLFRRETWASS